MGKMKLTLKPANRRKSKMLLSDLKEDNNMEDLWKEAQC